MSFARTNVSKVICIILTMAMLISILPVMQFAVSAEEIVITTETDGYKEEAGTWGDSSLKAANDAKGRYSSTVPSKCSYVPTIATAGTYKVSLYIVPNPGREDAANIPNAKVTIKHAAGTEEKTMDFNTLSGWQELGTFEFAAGTDGYVSTEYVEQADKGNLRAGGAKFELVGGSGSGTTTPTSKPTVSTAPSTAGTVFSDIADSKYQKAITLLSDIEVLAGDPDGKFRPLDTITRAEMAAILVRIVGLENSVASNAGDTQFTDVPSSHWGAGYVNIASSLGAIRGDGDGTFRPDDKVTYTEAVKMLVCIAGYEIYANEKGGWPTGYLVQANTLGITKNVTSDNLDGDATREIVAQLTANTIKDVDYMGKIAYGDKFKYVSTQGKTLMTEKLKINKVEGTVTENYYSSVMGTSDLKEDQVKINNIKYLVGSTKIADWLGYPVVAYLKYDKDVDIDYSYAVHFELADKLTVVDIKPEDIKTATSSYIEYYLDKDNSDKTERYDLTGNSYIIENGLGVADFDMSRLNPDENMDPSFDGSVKIITKDSSEKINTLFASIINTIVVDKVSKSSGKYIFTNKYQNGLKNISIDTNDKDVRVTVTKNGKAAELSDIAEFNVISLAQNGKNYDLKVSDNKQAGVITEEEEDYVYIGGNAYEYSRSAKNLVATKPSVSDDVTVYFDVFGKIAYVQTNQSGAKNYAYLLNWGMVETTYGEEELQMKLVTQDNKIAIYKAADRIRLVGPNSNTMYKASDLNDAILEDLGLSNKKQLIKYNANSNQQLTQIEVATNLGSTAPRKYTDEQLNLFRYSAPTGSYTTYKGNPLSFNGKRDFVVPSSALVLFEPISASTDIDIAIDDEDVQFVPASFFKSGRYYKPGVWYDADGEDNVGVITYEADVTGHDGVNVRGNYMIVKRVSEFNDADGSRKAKVYGYGDGGAEVEAVFDNVDVSDTSAGKAKLYSAYITVDDLLPGDVICYEKMPNGKIYTFRLIFTVAKVAGKEAEYGTAIDDFAYSINTSNGGVNGNKEQNESLSFSDLAFSFVYGNVTEFDGVDIYVEGTGWDYNFQVTGAQAYRYDVLNKKLSTMDVADVPFPYEDIDADGNVTKVQPKVYLRINQSQKVVDMIYIDEGLFD